MTLNQSPIPEELVGRVEREKDRLEGTTRIHTSYIRQLEGVIVKPSATKQIHNESKGELTRVAACLGIRDRFSKLLCPNELDSFLYTILTYPDILSILLLGIILLQPECLWPP